MPHVIVKLWPGKSEAEKTRLAEKIAQDVMETLNYGEERLRRHGGDRILGLGEAGLSARHQGQAGSALQKAWIHHVMHRSLHAIERDIRS
jgi:hypothetical protein